MTLKITWTLAIVTQSHCASIQCLYHRWHNFRLYPVWNVSSILLKNKKNPKKKEKCGKFAHICQASSIYIYHLVHFSFWSNFQQNQQPKTIVRPWYTGAKAHTCGWTSGTIECSLNNVHISTITIIIITKESKLPPAPERLGGMTRTSRRSVRRIWSSTNIKQTNKPLQWIWNQRTENWNNEMKLMRLQKSTR